jgi:hypothetical protein
VQVLRVSPTATKRSSCWKIIKEEEEEERRLGPSERRRGARIFQMLISFFLCRYWEEGTAAAAAHGRSGGNLFFSNVRIYIFFSLLGWGAAEIYHRWQSLRPLYSINRFHPEIKSENRSTFGCATHHSFVYYHQNSFDQISITQRSKNRRNLPTFFILRRLGHFPLNL